MSNRKNLRLLALVALLLLIVVPAASYISSIFGDHSLFPGVHPAHAAPNGNIVGINCAYGSIGTGGIPIQTHDNNGTLQSICPWAGDVDGDGAFDPLVSDNPSLLPLGSGGGFIADV